MITKNYKIAGHSIAITSIYPAVHEYCKDYLTDEPAEFTVETAQADIDFEIEKSRREQIAEGKKIHTFPEDYLEELAVYRKIADKMADFDTILFHGSVIAVDGNAYLFTAKSGTGKSTHTRLWRQMLGERAVMVNDDKPLLHIGENGVTAYGTPYNGKHRLGCNMSAPLKALCILTRAEQNQIERITKSEAYSMLIQQVYRPMNPVQLGKVLHLIDRLAAKTELYRLGCNMDPQAAEVAYNGMKG